MITLVLLLLIFCTSAIAQEDVCEGGISMVGRPGDLYEVCWKRNHENDNVDHYKVFDNDHPEPAWHEHGEEVSQLMDADCMEIHCFSGPLVVPSEHGVHYLTVRAFDSNDYWSGASNDVILTVELLVLPAEALTVEVVN